MAFQSAFIKNLLDQVTTTIKRFPITTLFSIIGTWSAVELTSGYLYDSVSENLLTRILMTAAIGMPLSLAGYFFLTVQQIHRKKRLGLVVVFFVIILTLLFCLNPEQYPEHIVQFILMLVAVHLLVSFAPFTNNGDTLAFWQFNKILFIRLITGLLYCTVLSAGLSAAFGVVDSIFGINLNWNYLHYAFIIIFGIVNTLFFLNGLPANPLETRTDVPYPKSLAFFSRYILVPLASIYLVILLAYEIKILIQWELPKGLVSSLILGYSAIGLLAILLVYPIQDNKDNTWIKAFRRYFFLFLLPLVFLLLLAVTTRINSYGVTQYRYFIIAIAAWLLFLIGYFLLYQSPSIKAIPISLFILIMLITFGPQSAISVSLRSQLNVLHDLFKKEELLVNDKLIPIKENATNSYSAIRMASTLDYLLKNYNFTALQPLLSLNLEKQEKLLQQTWKKMNNNIVDPRGYMIYRNSWLERYLRLGGYQYRQQYSEDQLETLSSNYYVKTKTSILNTKGYDYVMESNPFPDASQVDSINGYKLYQRESLEYDNVKLNIDTLEFNFSVVHLAEKLYSQAGNLKVYEDQNSSQGLDKRYLLPAVMLQSTIEKAGIKVTLQIRELSFDYSKKNGIRTNSVRAYYIINF
ncbi:MAG: DUF4153 domain-containing protein [Pedobacter sp.]|nr:MAG: DUF4153 domain-containing protein [Pedobacter sp.]